MYDLSNSIGLQNCGNTCYMNSAIQMLYSINEIREYIINENMNNVILKNLKKIFLEINKKNTKYIDNNFLKKIYIILYKNFVNNLSLSNNNSHLNIQNDSTEFFFSLFNIISSHLRDNIFHLNEISKTYCKNKINKTINKEESKIDITSIIILQIKKDNDQSVQSILNNSHSFDKLDTSLSRCNNKNNSYQEFYYEIPNENKYLFIELRRSGYNSKGKTIFLKNYVKVNKNITINQNSKKIKYILLGVILKSGELNYGHYIYVTYKNNKIHKVYDDSTVYNYLGTNFNIDHNATLLLYVKKILTENNNNNNQNNENLVKRLIEMNSYQNNPNLVEKLIGINNNQNLEKILIEMNNQEKEKYIHNKQKHSNYNISLNEENKQKNSNYNISLNEENKQKQSNYNIVSYEENNKNINNNNQKQSNYQIASKLQQEYYNEYAKMLKNVYNQNNNQNNYQNNYKIALKLQEEYNLEYAKMLQQEYNNEYIETLKRL